MNPCTRSARMKLPSRRIATAVKADLAKWTRALKETWATAD